MKPLLIILTFSAVGLTACDQGNAENSDTNNSEAIEMLLQRTEKNLVYVKGGSFQMGDFGVNDPKGDYLRWSYREDDKHLHKVTLDGYYIMDRQVSYADYDTYTEATGQPKINTDNRASHTRMPNVPAGVDWFQARDYCQWLANESGKPYALPTEAQWEYAARSRGKMMPYATDDGILREGINYPTREERLQMTSEHDAHAPYFIAKKYPPNPLGIYQMGLNGFEWVRDWYGEDYYELSPEYNPTGPDSGTLKVRRGGPTGGSLLGLLTMIRSSYNADLAFIPPEGSKSIDLYKGIRPNYQANSVRCVLNNTL